MECDNLKLFYTNASSLLNKLDELRMSISLYSPDVICVCESHLNKEIEDFEVNISGFTCFRVDRKFRKSKKGAGPSCVGGGECSDTSGGGGSIIYIRSELNAKLAVNFNAPDSLACSFECNLGVVVIACVYRTPALSGTQNTQMLNSIRRLCVDNSENEVILVGDLNLPDVCWVSGTVGGPVDTKDKGLIIQNDYVDLITELGLTWHVTDEITRRRVVGGVLQESTLDQVISSNDALVNGFEILSPLGKSDHHCVLVDLNITGSMSTNTNSFVRSRKPLWGEMKDAEILRLAEDIDWSSSVIDNSETIWVELKEKMLSITEKVPSYNVNCGNVRSKRVPWENSSLKRARRDKDKFWAVFDSDATTNNLYLALHRQRKYEESEISAKIKYEKKITSNLKHANKPFFSYLRSKTKLNVTLTKLRKADGSETVDAEDTAEELSSFFGSVFCEETFGPMEEDCYTSHSGSIIDDMVINVDDVKKELSSININKSQGPDGIHPKLLRALAGNQEFVNAVYRLFCACACTRKMPTDWKEANVVALHKKGPRNLSENHRPVSLTCILGKVYEKFVRKHILDHISSSISPEQHGFVSGRSCTSNLLESLDAIIDMMDEGIPVDLLFFDFRKAFDTVPHGKLLVKLENLGIKGGTPEIIQDFLTGRRMRVGVGDSFSKFIDILSGVPQGSVLGPILFLVFINDLPESIISLVLMFADDLKLIANASRFDIVDADLKALERWQDKWQLRFNPIKCKVLHISGNDNPQNIYSLDGIQLESIESEKDLGLIVNNKLDFGDQIKKCLSKANKMIAWISRNIICKSKDVMVLIYRSLIRPHLEYCVQAWSPTPRFGNWGLILNIEKVQRKFTRLINDIGTLPYGARLQSLKLTTLAERRIRGDLIEVFKIVRGIVNYGQNMFRMSRSNLNILSRGSKISNLRKDFFSERVINHWNSLPNNVKLSTSVDTFKINLEVYKQRSIKDSLDGNDGKFWEVSEHILNRIESPSYLAGRPAFSQYMEENPWSARRKGINIFRSQQ